MAAGKPAVAPEFGLTQSRGMVGESFMMRMAPMLRLPVFVLGAFGGAGSIWTLLGWLSDRAAYTAAAILAVPGALLFLAGVVDGRLQDAVQALNADQGRGQWKQTWLARVTGSGLPVEDRLLHLVNLWILLPFLLSMFRDARPSAGVLAFASCWLVTVVLIPLMARRHLEAKAAVKGGD